MNGLNSFVNKIRASRVDSLFLVNAIDQERECWFYMEVEKSKIPLFEKKVTEFAAMDLEEWGRVIISGWGHVPPQKVQDKIKAENASFSLTEQEAKQDIMFVTSEHEGSPFYSFVLVPNYLKDEFKYKYTIGGFDFRDYGEIVFSDWGNPSKDVMDYMAENYNADSCMVRHMLEAAGRVKTTFI